MNYTELIFIPQLQQLFKTTIMKLTTAVVKTAFIFTIALSAIFFYTNTLNAQTQRVLVFSKTDGFRHASIGAGKTAFAKMATEKSFAVDFTEDAAQFATAKSKKI